MELNTKPIRSSMTRIHPSSWPLQLTRSIEWKTSTKTSLWARLITVCFVAYHLWWLWCCWSDETKWISCQSLGKRIIIIENSFAARKGRLLLATLYKRGIYYWNNGYCKTPSLSILNQNTASSHIGLLHYTKNRTQEKKHSELCTDIYLQLKGICLLHSNKRDQCY